MKIIPDILSTNDINRLMTDNRINQARDRLTDDKGRVDFFIDIPEDIRKKLSLSFDFEVNERVPLRWIRGDSVLHSDYSWDHISYNNSYLVYLTDGKGLFMIDDLSFPIKSGDGYSFETHRLHGTYGATDTRLLLGPMNERSVPVGFGTGIYYNDPIDPDHIYYYNGSVSGNLFSFEQINALTMGVPFVVPPGKIFVGWRYNVSSSFSPTTPANLDQSINGGIPIDGHVYIVGAPYNADTTDSGNGGISMTAVYEDPPSPVIDDKEEEIYENPLKKLKNARQYKTLEIEKVINNYQ